jgi:hypothetical protein
MSPSDLGHVIKPFVFLDLAVFVDGEERAPMEYLWHPHSGIATVTVGKRRSVASAVSCEKTERSVSHVQLGRSALEHLEEGSTEPP